MNTNAKTQVVSFRNVAQMLVAVPLLAASLVGCASMSTGPDRGPHQVEYIVGGTAKATDVTYSTDGLKATQHEVAKAPWTKKLSIKRDITAVYTLTVKSADTKPGAVTCEIKVDGESVNKATNKGVAAITSCEYTPADH